MVKRGLNKNLRKFARKRIYRFYIFKNNIKIASISKEEAILYNSIYSSEFHQLFDKLKSQANVFTPNLSFGRIFETCYKYIRKKNDESLKLIYEKINMTL